MKDPIREYLRKRGCPEHVVKGGFEGLIETWEVVVNEVAYGYDLSLDEYLNDMDIREIIEGVVPLLSKASHKALVKKLQRLDAMMKTLVEPRSEPLWGSATARERGWTPEKNWWYFSQPKNPGPDLRSELER